MQYIRKIVSAVSKIAYPSGVTQTLGTLALEPIAKIPDISSLGYNDNSIFQNDDDNPAKWSFSRGTFISRTTLKDGKPFGKMVAVQKRFSNDGTIFPPNVNAYLGTVWYNNVTGTKDMQHKLNILRNATTYSPVQELAVFQAIIKAHHRDFTPDLGIRVDKDIATDAGLYPVYLKPVMEDIYPENPNIVGGGSATVKAWDSQRKPFSAIYQGRDGRLIETEDWVESTYEVMPGCPKGMSNYRDGAKAYYNRFNRQFIRLSLYDFDNWKTKLKYIRISSYNTSAELGYVLPISSEMIDMMGRAKAKGHELVILTCISMTGQLFDTGTSNIGRKEYADACLYRNDIVEGSIEVDPAGEFIKFRLTRPGKYTVWFNNEIYAFEKFTADGLVNIPKTTRPFTAGGLLEISLIGNEDNYPQTTELVVPDTIPPNPPTILSYATDAVYGTAESGDRVFVERGGVVIGQGMATSTNTYEVRVPANDLENGQTVFVYTKDTAGNESTKVEGTVTDIISSLKFDIADPVNVIRYDP